MENIERVNGPETRVEWIARQRAARLALRERMWREAVRDPHWLNRANRHLERALEENATRYGLNSHAAVETPVLQAPERPQEAILPPTPPVVEQRSADAGELGGFAV